MWFASDNTAPAAPEILAALARANEGHAASYGEDAITARVTARIREIFAAPEAAVHLVATGTAANALAVATLCPPWGTVYCHAEAHLNVDECGAPEFYTGGAKLVPVPGAGGRMDPAALAGTLARGARAGIHNTQKGAVSLTNATEAGTVYAPAEVAAIADIARAHGLPVHMDGARFANALVRLGCSPAELTWTAGVDALSLGGTKNGLLGAEAVILFDPARDWPFQLRRKRGGHLFSKARFLAAQFEAWLEDGLWLRLAARANARADRLAAGLRAAGGRLLHEVGANMMFAALPRAAHRRLMAAGARYYLWEGDRLEDGPPDELLVCRLVCGWATEEAEVDRFLDVLAGAEAPADAARAAAGR